MGREQAAELAVTGVRGQLVRHGHASALNERAPVECFRLRSLGRGRAGAQTGGEVAYRRGRCLDRLLLPLRLLVLVVLVGGRENTFTQLEHRCAGLFGCLLALGLLAGNLIERFAQVGGEVEIKLFGGGGRIERVA